MKDFLKKILVLTSLSTLMCVSAIAAPSDTTPGSTSSVKAIGTVSEMTGDVNVKGRETSMHALHVGDRVYQDDFMYIPSAAKVCIKFDNGVDHCFGPAPAQGMVQGLWG